MPRSERSREAVSTTTAQTAACGVGGVRNSASRREAVTGAERTVERAGICPAEVNSRSSRRAAVPDRESFFKILFQFRKMGLFRYISHLDLLDLFSRSALRSSSLPVAATRGFNPKPRLSIPFPLMLGVESRCELGEVFVEEPLVR